MEEEKLEANENTQTEFLNDLNSMLSVQTDYEKKEFNYTWLELFEEVIPYIDNIVRNPKRFIINEEEIVKVELAKKITVESVIHLTQHTNLIQDYDQKKGDVRPSKILNINKEESLDTYENRFVYTLILNMNTFYSKHASNLGGESYYRDEKNLKYEGNTKLGNEDIKVSIELKALDKDTKVHQSKDGLNIQDRLKKIKIQLDGFMGSELMQTLSKLHVAEVRSPIRKTNVILKNPNFQKATELWNFIQSYNTDDLNFEKDKQDYMDNGDIKNKFDQAFILAYLATNPLAKTKKSISEQKMISIAIAKVIENILDMDDQILESKLSQVFKKEFKDAKEKLGVRNKKILKLFIDYIEREKKKIEEAYTLLK